MPDSPSQPVSSPSASCPPEARFLIVGAGFSGSVLARELVERLDCKVLVVDSRNHVAGNCHTERDAETGVLIHRYGPHIFHTDSRRVWDYVNRHAEMMPFVNRVKASLRKGIFSMPINLHTINQFFGKRFTPSEAQAFIASIGDASIREPANFEEQALKFIGRDLYEAFFYGYTCKQWGVEPKELPASILKRLPVRFNYDDNYYNHPFQAIPKKGYTALIEHILDHPRIGVQLNHVFEASQGERFEHVIFTGPLDAYFGHSLGRLRYRTVFWKEARLSGDAIGNPVLNYPELEDPFTRVLEHKHFAPWEKHERTALFTEFSKATEPGDVPYYPLRLEADKQLLFSYWQKALQTPRVSFLGRLATYRYLDMDRIIAEALEFADAFVESIHSRRQPPVFPAGISPLV